MRILFLLLAPAVLALPGDQEIRDRLQSFQEGNSNFPCTAKECQKPKRQFERISNTQAGIQWMDAGGYCGSWSIQRAVMAKGAWISQQQVRNHTVPGGGHDEEILATKDVAFRNLKIAAEGFDYKNLPVPQVDSYRKWIKKQLVNGHTLVYNSANKSYHSQTYLSHFHTLIDFGSSCPKTCSCVHESGPNAQDSLSEVWMIMLDGMHYPVYHDLPYGLYSHVEPVVGIMSDHPLTDENFYDDDVVLHYTDV